MAFPRALSLNKPVLFSDPNPNTHTPVNLLTIPFLLAQISESSSDAPTPQELTPGQAAGIAAAMGTIMIVTAVVALLVIIGMWKIFTKAGQPGWASLIPIYNTYILCKISGKSGWWVVLMMIPLVGAIFWILLNIALAEKFGKGAGYGVGLAFLFPIFYPLLGFSDARYQGAGGYPLPGAAY